MKELKSVLLNPRAEDSLVDSINKKLEEIQKDYVLYQVVEHREDLRGYWLLLLVEKR